MSPLAVFLSLPLKDRLAILAGGLAIALGAWLVVVAAIVLT